MAFNSMGSLFYLLCQWLLTVVVVPLCSFEAAGILTLAISLTNVFFTLATFGIRIFQVSDSQGKYGPGLYISTRVFTCLCSFALCAAFLLCTCLAFPGALARFMVGANIAADLAEAGALALVGLCGAVCALGAVGEAAPEEKPAPQM